jgi:hypothetical protein
VDRGGGAECIGGYDEGGEGGKDSIVKIVKVMVAG